MKSILPLKVNYCPVTKLALIPFEKHCDKIYKCFELQEIFQNGNVGYRVIAYRADQYVDVYDDFALEFNENEKFDVTENGLHKHIQTAITNVNFKKDNNCECISFEFVDVEQRIVKFYIEEFSKKKTKPMNLLAPIGYGSKNPNFLPLFFMYDFDFIRRRKTKIQCFIDDKEIKVDKFSFPMNMQFRYFIRYSNNCQLIEFINTDEADLLEVELVDNKYIDKNIEYIFSEVNSLQEIIVKLEKGNINICFSPSFNINSSGVGEFRIAPKEEMGYVSGKYAISRNSNVVLINLSPSLGWKSVPNSKITKMILSPKSVFCTWSKFYSLNLQLNLESMKMTGIWENSSEEEVK